MILDKTFHLNNSVGNSVATSNWGTSLGQENNYFITKDGAEDILKGIINNYISKDRILKTSFKKDSKNELILQGVFSNVKINYEDTLINLTNPLLLMLIIERNSSHNGRRTLKYNKNSKFKLNNRIYSNKDLFNEISATIANGSLDAAWLCNEMIYSYHENTIILRIHKISDHFFRYPTLEDRKNAWEIY